MSDPLNSTDDEIPLGELIGSLWAQKLLIIFVASLSLFYSVYYVLTTEKEFTATAVFQIEQVNKPGINISSEIGALASIAGLAGGDLSGSATSLLERVMAREFILGFSKKNSLSDDPFFNTYNPNHQDPLWKSTIKKFIGWKKIAADDDVIIENNIIANFRAAIEATQTEGNAISISVTHNIPKKSSDYANIFMEEIRLLVEYESNTAQELRLTYLSETLADALQEMEIAQQNLKDYALENSTMAEVNFNSGSLKLNELRMERRKVSEISNVLSILNDMIKSGDLDTSSYEALRSSNPLVDDIDFRRILGMSETISAWTWPNVETVQAVSTTLRDRIKRLDVDIAKIEDDAKIYATSAEGLAKFTRDAKIAEATYTVLIEQVKSQSLAAGFQPNTFTVFQYATPPLTASHPNRRFTLILGTILGLFLGCALAALNGVRRNVYYTSKAIISDSKPNLTLKSKSIRKLSRKSVSVITSYISNRRVLEVDEAEVKLADKKIVYVLNCGGKPTASGTARLLAAQSSTSGRKVILCDKTGQSEKELEGKLTRHISGCPIIDLDDNIAIMTGNNASSFFTISNFNKTIEDLLVNFDQVFICSTNSVASVGLMALKDFNPSIVLLAGLRKTRKLDIKKIIANQPIDILFYD